MVLTAHQRGRCANGAPIAARPLHLPVGRLAQYRFHALEHGFGEQLQLGGELGKAVDWIVFCGSAFRPATGFRLRPGMSCVLGATS
ncbi:hypothetical protein [Nocardia sp. XZ_19_369]|uniref:hypothetical protein n=1 Tax=Nocardia sp. XZ_19_369 TaxID=2769487 RepID=UPI001E316453|nr:hypothetical protein [Nocardia sp. XZ_19_369]